jgi:nitrate/nitrite-specific signal transduction histidine kinase
LLELEEKNKELTRMNEVLEEKVKERTWQLQQRTEILDMILENVSIDDVLAKSCKAISKMTGSDSVFINVPFLEKTFSISQAKMSDSTEELGQNAVKNNRIMKTDNAFAAPLGKGSAVLGALIIDRLQSAENDAAKAIESFSSVISIALSQQKMLKDAPRLLDNIDKMIEEM